MNILLYSLVQPALIIPMHTGIFYQNQTAGGCCNQRSQEGILIPVSGYYVTDEIKKICLNHDILNNNEADAIEAIWKEAYLHVNIKINRNMLHDSEEAWLNVIVNPADLYIEHGSYNGEAILTWDNSD